MNSADVMSASPTRGAQTIELGDRVRLANGVVGTVVSLLRQEQIIVRDRDTEQATGWVNFRQVVELNGLPYN